MKDLENKRLFYFLIAVSLINIIIFSFIYPSLPQRIPLHWGPDGMIDSYGPKAISFLIFSIPLFLSLGMFFIPKTDPKRENYKKFETIYSNFAVGITFFFIMVCWLIVLSALNILGFENSNTVPRIICLTLGILGIILGNYAPKIKQNWYFGFRTPWALTNKVIWQKTQRMSGYFLIILGILFIGTSLTLNIFFTTITFIFLFTGVIFIYIYSYLLFKKMQKN